MLTLIHLASMNNIVRIQQKHITRKQLSYPQCHITHEMIIPWSSRNFRTCLLRAA